MPDKSHIHHSIMRLGLSHGKTTIFLGITNVLYIGFCVALRNLNDNYVLLGIVLLSILLSVLLDRVIIKRVNKESSAGEVV